MTPSPFVPDPALYRDLSAPFASPEDAQAALAAFWADVQEARKRHRLADVVVVVQVPVRFGEEEGVSASVSHLGNWQNKEAMLARALGDASAEREALLAVLAAGGGRKR